MAAIHSCFTTVLSPVRVLPYVRRLVKTTQSYPPAAIGAKVGSKFQEIARACREWVAHAIQTGELYL